MDKRPVLRDMSRLSVLFALLAFATEVRAIQPDVFVWAREQNVLERRATLEASIEVERLIESHRRSYALTYVETMTFAPGSPPHVEHGPMRIGDREVDARRVARLDPLRKLPPLQRVIAQHMSPARAVARLRLARQPVLEGAVWRYDFAFPSPPNAPSKPGSSDSLSLWLTARGDARLVRSRARLEPPRAGEPLLIEATYARHSGLDVVDRRRAQGVFVMERRGRGFSYRIDETQRVRIADAGDR